jgi:hypothetical protein
MGSVVLDSLTTKLLYPLYTKTKSKAEVNENDLQFLKICGQTYFPPRVLELMLVATEVLDER